MQLKAELGPDLERQMKFRRHALTFCLMAATGVVSANASADETVARWVDEDGVTHFGSPQFAPSTATSVRVAPTNGMDAPENTATVQSSASRPVWTVIGQAEKQNRIGWRAKGQKPQSGPVAR